MKIREIAYAVGLPAQHPTFKNPTQVGTIDTRIVVTSTEWSGVVLYGLVDDSTITSWIAISDAANNRHAINRVIKYTNQSGHIAALINFLIKKLGLKLVVSSDEALTKDGISWLIKLIQHGGLTTSDQHKKLIDITALKQEWETAKDTGTAGETAVYIESEIRLPVHGTAKNTMWETIRYIGNDLLE